MFSISVCMIVKNEEKVLARILKCAKKFADEIIVVDTGSTDKTKEIAKSFTDKIFDFEWVDDFSKARNFAFEKATCDYQMWLDADDFVSQENINQIIMLKKINSNADVYMFKYATGFNKDDHPYLVFYRERLLKRSKNFKWEGFVHEAISPSGKVEYCDITIEHRKLDSHDPKRNLKLYQKALKRKVKFNARETYYYARELYYNGYYFSAIKNLKKFLKIPNTYEADNLGAHIMLCDCYEIKKDYQNGLNTLFDALKTHEPTAEVCCRIGYIFDNLNKSETAIFWFNSALLCKKQTNGFVREDFSDIIPHIELTRLYYQTKNFELAKQHHFKAKEIRPTHPSVLYNDKFFE